MFTMLFFAICVEAGLSVPPVLIVPAREGRWGENGACFCVGGYTGKCRRCGDACLPEALGLPPFADTTYATKRRWSGWRPEKRRIFAFPDSSLRFFVFFLYD
ncbi:unnamed protein product, partial [Scytosiphon promiscuus]